MQQLYDTSSPEGKRKVIDGYRQAVKLSPGLSFKSFCDQSCITDKYETMLWWANGHGIRMLDIQYGRESIIRDVTPTFIQVRPRSQSPLSVLRGVSITFPDGVNLTLQESGVSEVIALLDAYQSRHQAAGGARECSH